MCVYVVVFVGCCCICGGGPHLTWLRQLHGIRVTHSNSQTNCPLKRTPAQIRRCPSVRPRLSCLLQRRVPVGPRARVRNFYGGPASCRPRGRSNSKGTTLPAAKCQTNVLSKLRTAQPSRHMPPPLRPLADDVRVRRAALKQHHLLYTQGRLICWHLAVGQN